MNLRTALHLLPVIFATASRAAEVTVEPKPFAVETSFSATALPDPAAVLLQAQPKAWADFKITKIAAHGSKVTKGDVLLAFDTENIVKKIEDSRRSLASSELALAQAELDLKNLEETSPHKIEALRRAARIAKEENTYFTQTRRKAAGDTADQALKRAKERLDNEQEELKQLAAMYKADDITEDTEEIILTRQKDAVAAADFALQMETLDHKRSHDVTLPREAVTLTEAERDTAIALAKAELDIPRAIQLKKIELAGQKSTLEREKTAITELEHDHTLFEIKAPADGWFYHGPIENGRWVPNPDLLKTLAIHGHPPVNRPIATFVPATAKLSLVAFVDEAAARSLKAELAGTATLTGREDLEIPAKLATIAPTPGTDGTYRADLTATWPKDLTPVTGSTAKVTIESYRSDKTIALPSKAITRGPAGWTVDVKLADGKTEKRVVKRGRSSGEEAEILSGLEAGQVIVIP
jgi:HlyD family secretion protein